MCHVPHGVVVDLQIKLTLMQANAKLDRYAACCASGVLDACGVCDGTAKRVDAQVHPVLMAYCIKIHHVPSLQLHDVHGCVMASIRNAYCRKLCCSLMSHMQHLDEEPGHRRLAITTLCWCRRLSVAQVACWMARAFAVPAEPWTSVGSVMGMHHHAPCMQSSTCRCRLRLDA